jgi:hypothetical protein
VFGDGFADRGVGGDDGLDVQACAEFDVVHREDVGGIRHRERERVAGAGDRNDVVFGGSLARDQAHQRGVELEIAQIDGRYAVLTAEDFGHVLVLQVAQFDKGRPESPAVGALKGQRLLKLGRSDALIAQQ